MVCVLIGLMAVGPRAAPASGKGLDQRSARTFLIDATNDLRGIMMHRQQVKAAIGRFIEHLESSCPGVLAAAPPAIVEHVEGAPPWKEEVDVTPAQRATSQTFLAMALGELKVAGFAPIRVLSLAFANELAHLRWTRQRVAQALSGLRQSIIATSALDLPDLCVDARASAAIGFVAAPPEAMLFVDAFRAAALVSNGRDLSDLTALVLPALARRDLGLLTRFRRLWARAAPVSTVSDASAFRLVRAVFTPHS